MGTYVTETRIHNIKAWPILRHLSLPLCVQGWHFWDVIVVETVLVSWLLRDIVVSMLVHKVEGLLNFCGLNTPPGKFPKHQVRPKSSLNLSFMLGPCPKKDPRSRRSRRKASRRKCGFVPKEESLKYESSIKWMTPLTLTLPFESSKVHNLVKCLHPVPHRNSRYTTI